MIEAAELALWNFHCEKTPVGSSKAEMQFPHPLFPKGWKFIFALPTAVEIKCGRKVEIGGINFLLTGLNRRM
jgi:hypothetical protein